MDKYCDLYNIVGGSSDDYEVAYDWDDSILIDKDSERQVDMLDVNEGRMSKVEYRMKWYGETEVQANESLQRIADEQTESMKRKQELLLNNQDNSTNAVDNSINNTDNSTRDNLDRAHESNEPTKTKDKS